jgi:hypothetical protein
MNLQRISAVICLVFLAASGVDASASDRLAQDYQRIRAEGTRLAGAPGDIPARVRELEEIYLDSGGNHAFPLVAAHGAMWAQGYFTRGGAVGEAISYRYFYDEAERERRLAMLNEFAVSFQKTNRQVFIDTYTNYHFSKDHGQEPGAERYIPRELLSWLNRAHQATRDGRSLGAWVHRELFRAALLWEQESMVASSVQQAVDRFDCPILKVLALKPVVRFEYFPLTRAFLFKDFSDKNERIDRALESYELAVDAGWEEVYQSLDDY